MRALPALIELARARPGELTFSSSGTSGTGHLSGELFATLAKVKLVHVPYRGTGPATLAVLSGEVTFGFGNLVAVSPHVQSRRLQALAVTSARRLAAAPDLPTVAEAGVAGYEYVTWYGVLAPAATPRDIIARLNAEIVKVLRLPEVRERLQSMGIEIVANTPAEFAAFMREETTKWGRIVKESGAKID